MSPSPELIVTFNQTGLDNSNAKLVCYSDPNCIIVLENVYPYTRLSKIQLIKLISLGYFIYNKTNSAEGKFVW